MENRRKTGVFAWKTTVLNVENTESMAYREYEKLQSLARLVFFRVSDKNGKPHMEHGKAVDKIFLYVGKYVENVTNRVKSSFLAPFGSKNLVLYTPYLVLTY